MCLEGVGMSEVYMLKSVGERTPPGKTLVLNQCCRDVMFLKVCKLRIPMWFAMNLVMLLVMLLFPCWFV